MMMMVVIVMVRPQVLPGLQRWQIPLVVKRI